MTLRIRGLRHAYPGSGSGLRLDVLDLDPGETLAVIGPSGSGKTTFLNLLSALIRPQEGTILVQETEVQTLTERQAQHYRAQAVGYVFQDFGLLDYLSAADNILHPFRISRGRRVSPEIRRRAEALALDLGIGNRLSHRPAQLSQGERQRVAICRAVLTDPQLLLADEPTGNLDPEAAARIMDLLWQVRDRLGATLVMVTHDHALLERFDRVLDLRDCRGNSA